MSDPSGDPVDEERGARPTRPPRAYRLGWGPVAMMLLAFGALALAVLAAPLVGFGALIVVFLAICGVMLLVMVRYGRRNQAEIKAFGDPSERRLPGR